MRADYNFSNGHHHYLFYALYSMPRLIGVFVWWRVAGRGGGARTRKVARNGGKWTPLKHPQLLEATYRRLELATEVGAKWREENDAKWREELIDLPALLPLPRPAHDHRQSARDKRCRR